jgi:hypothetical protein
MFIYDAKGIKLNGYELFLDAHRVVPFSFISHGHSDHLRNHKKILTTAPTNEFFAIRSKQRKRTPRRLFWTIFNHLKWTIVVLPCIQPGTSLALL